MWVDVVGFLFADVCLKFGWTFKEGVALGGVLAPYNLGNVPSMLSEHSEARSSSTLQALRTPLLDLRQMNYVLFSLASSLPYGKAF